MGDDRARHDGLARPGRSDEHAEVVTDEIRHGGGLLRSQSPAEVEIGGRRIGSIIGHVEPALERLEQGFDLAGESSREVEPLEVLAVAR